MVALSKKKSKLKLPKPRIPVPKGDKVIPDPRKEASRKACRKKVDTNTDGEIPP